MQDKGLSTQAFILHSRRRQKKKDSTMSQRLSRK
jgi:hypothetical protein